MNEDRKQFYSLTEYHQYLSATPKVCEGRSSEDPERDLKWDLGWGWDKTIDLSSKGGYWQEGVNKIREDIFGFEQGMEMGNAPSLELDVSGFAPSVPDFIIGNPCTMYNEEQENSLRIARKPIVKICVDTAATWIVSAEQMENRGIAIATLANYLESQGQRCEIWARGTVYSGHTSNTLCIWDVQVKRSDSYWSPSEVAFALISPGFFRRLGFAYLETKDYMKHACTKYGGYGQTGKVPTDLDSWDIYFPTLCREDHDPTDEASFEKRYTQSMETYSTVEGSIDYIKRLSEGLL